MKGMFDVHVTGILVFDKLAICNQEDDTCSVLCTTRDRNFCNFENYKMEL